MAGTRPDVQTLVLIKNIKLFPILRYLFCSLFVLLMKHYIICECYKQNCIITLNFLAEVIDLYREEVGILPEEKYVSRKSS